MNNSFDKNLQSSINSSCSQHADENILKQPPPSDEWSAYSNSEFSSCDMDEHQKKRRTSSYLGTTINTMKMFIGITFISVPARIKDVGIYGAAIGFIYMTLICLYSTWLILKVRDRFKHRDIVDLSDLACIIYGDGARFYMQLLVVSSNCFYLMAYNMFFGYQFDQIFCETFQIMPCGNQRLYPVFVNIMLLPVLFQKEFESISKFVGVILVFTFISIFIMIYICFKIKTEPLFYFKEDQVKDLINQENLVYWNLAMFPQFCSAMIALFEGNQVILNVYSQAKEPKKFQPTYLICGCILSLGFGAFVGYLGYFTFGQHTQQMLFLNLPSNSVLATISRLLYVTTIFGSYVLLCQPVFHIIENSKWYQNISGA